MTSVRILAGIAIVLGGAGCAGGQTGQDGSGSGGAGGACDTSPFTVLEADALIENFEGTHRTLAVRSSSTDRCPAGPYVTLEVTVTSLLSAEALGEKPCGARWIPVTLRVSTDDDALDSTFDAWLSEEGSIVADGIWISLPRTGRSFQLSGFGLLRPVDDCCGETPPEWLTNGASLGTTDILTLNFHDPITATKRTTELALTLSFSPGLDGCDTAGGTFELRSGTGQLAASGVGTLTYSPTACEGASEPCLSVDYLGSGTVDSELALMSYGDYPGQLTDIDVYFSGRSTGGRLESTSLACEVIGDYELGVALATERP